MAEYDPAHQGGDWEVNEGYGAHGEQQEHTQHSTHEDEAEYSLNAPPNALGDGSSQDGSTDDVGDYDPASVTSAPAPESSALQTANDGDAPRRPSPQAIAKKSRAVGGFLVGDSDDEDSDDEDSDEAPVAAPSGPTPDSGSGQGTASLPIVSHPHAAANTGTPSNPSPTPQVTKTADAPTQSTGNGPAGPYPADEASPKPGAPAPTDRLDFLETRVTDDPRGAMDEWLELFQEYRNRGDIDNLRKAYKRFVNVFPQAAEIWIEQIDLESNLNNFTDVEGLFGLCLLGTPNVELWTKYLDYVRRRNDLSDSTGNARQTVAQAYEFVIGNIGIDKDSGKIWADYIQFLKFGPGVVGGSQWQDQQKMDQMRKAYQRAICVPIANVNTLWKEYDQFENGLNKLTGRKYLAEKSPSYMSAKSAYTHLSHITANLSRHSLPRLPPAPGFDGYEAYVQQVQIWKDWIAWEKEDHLDLRDDKDQPGLFQKRILYVYNQALMALRFWPEMWVEAAQWCLDENVTVTENGKTKDGKAHALEFLLRGIEANPESVLLALQHADFIESTYPIEENDEAKIARGEAVRAPYNKVLDTLYDIIKRLKERETLDIARAKEAIAAQDAHIRKSLEDDDDDEDVQAKKEDPRVHDRVQAIQKSYAAQTHSLSRTVSFVWIALIRAMRRIQGKGRPGTPLGGMRQAFADARQRGRLTSDVYAAVAQLEWTIYKDPAGGKIFDRGARLFPEDENFTLENIKYLHSRDDFTNARVLFETVVNRLAQKPEEVHRTKALYAYFHKYESQFGELAQIAKLEKRMAELFPQDPKLALFSARYSTDKFDPIAAKVIVSPTVQLRPPKLPLMPPSNLAELPQPLSMRNSPHPAALMARNSPRPQFLPVPNSPKRPAPAEDFEEPPRKMQRNDYQQDFQRAHSPIKGAAGRRLDQQRKIQGQNAATYSIPAAPIARDITFLMGLIPRADLYDYHRINPHKMVDLLQDTVVPEYSTWKSAKGDSHGQNQGHHRQVSTDQFGQYGFQNRDDPIQGRPISPYVGDARNRMPSGPTPYRQSSLRPGSSGSYEPPPAAYGQQPAAPPGPQHFNPPPVPVISGQYDGASWPPQYGAPPQAMNYGAPPPPQQQGYRYPY